MTILLTYALDNIHFDRFGYIKDASLWTPAVAEATAAREEITLSTSHWLVVSLARMIAMQLHEQPTLNQISNYCGFTIPHITQLFAPNAAAKIAMIAGLSHPLDDC